MYLRQTKKKQKKKKAVCIISKAWLSPMPSNHVTLYCVHRKQPIFYEQKTILKKKNLDKI